MKWKKIEARVNCIKCYTDMRLLDTATKALNEHASNYRKFRFSCPKCHTIIEITLTKKQK